MAEGDKFSKISNLLTSFIAPEPSEKSRERRVSDGTKPNNTQPLNREEFQKRVRTFEIGKWSLFNVSPLLCAQYGWHYFNDDVLECCTCKAYLSASIPPMNKQALYTYAIKKLKISLKEHHKKWCGWRQNPSPHSFLTPPKNISVHYLQKLKENTASLSRLEKKLPYIETAELLKMLDLNVTSLQCLIGSFVDPNPYQVDAAILSLCGWSYENDQSLKCDICLRVIGLWNYFSKQEKDLLKSLQVEAKQNKLVKQISDATAACESNLESTGTTNSPVYLADDECPIGREVELGNSGCSEPANKKICMSPPGVSNLVYVQTTEKQNFEPLKDHRFWCGWVTNIAEDKTETKGYMLLPPQLERLVPDISDNLVKSAKYSENVEGLKAVRHILTNSIH